jgi:hypothetical protein
VDRALLASTGPLAVWIDGDGLRLEPTHVARRMWSPGAVPPAMTVLRRTEAALVLDTADQ